MVVSLALLLGASAVGLEVLETRWGFHGKTLPGQFALLSVLVRNPASVPYDGEVAVFRDDGMDQRRGGFLVQGVYVSPGECRWLQFYPYVSSMAKSQPWNLGWGRRFRRRIEIGAPSLGAPATVVLEGQERTLRAAGGISRSLPEQLFPPCASACSGLYAVLLDHVPDWDPPRRRAFRDWFDGGGIVHLFHDVSGEFPRFFKELAVFNSTAGLAGHGRLIRHTNRLGEVDWQTWERSARAGPQLHANSGGRIQDLELPMFGLLGRVTRVERDWSAILWFAGFYSLLAALGPFLLFRRTRRPFAPLIAAVALSAVFSWGFRAVSLRGQDRESSLVVCNYARGFGGGRCDVTQWIHAFTGKGRRYAFESKGRGGVFSTCHDYEAVNAVVLQGSERRFMVDMPLASTRSFVHRAVFDSGEPTVKVTEFAVGEVQKTVRTTDSSKRDRMGQKLAWKKAMGEGLRKLGLDLQPPELAAAVREVVVAYAGDVYTLQKLNQEGRFSGPGAGVPLNQYCSMSGLGQFQYWRRRHFGGRLALEKACASCMIPVVTRALGGGEAFSYRLEKPGTTDGKAFLEVFIRVDDSSAFMPEVDGFPKRLGTSIYHVTLPARESTAEEYKGPE